jgi:hypothetical protein
VRLLVAERMAPVDHGLAGDGERARRRGDGESIAGGVPEDLGALVRAVARTAACGDSAQPRPEQRVLGLQAPDPLLEHGDMPGE